MVTLSTVMLIVLQHNAAHLGIATGLCLSEAASRYMPRLLKDLILLTAMLGGGSNGDGRDTRRSDCTADVVPYTQSDWGVS